MNNKHRKALQAVFSTPVPKGMPWVELESLLIAAGGTVTEGGGSRVKFEKDGITVAFHRPHKPKTARAYQVTLAREFLESIGVKP
jgi:hypothetical protein